MSDRKLNPSLKGQIIKIFAQTLADLKDPKEAHSFLKDFLTDAEIETFAKRLAIAYWLKKGRSYANIKYRIPAEPCKGAHHQYFQCSRRVSQK